MNASTDMVSEGLAAGTDKVFSSFTLHAHRQCENLESTGSDNLNGTGNTLANVLTGNNGVNLLTGGLGNDTYIVQNATDTVVENLNAGTDLVQSWRTSRWAPMWSTLHSRAQRASRVQATDSSNVLTGNSGINTLGTAGNDTLDGGAGDDTLTGGDGNDVFLVGNAAEHGVGEVIDGGAGIDVIRFTSTPEVMVW